ncbi:MAG: MBOAT family protein [Myxococcota bacterium]|nr:MBOAT family protein [Myxococcota bacterium]
MSFASLEFGLFFALVFAIYCALSHRGQNGFLLGASYVFYAAWDWRFVFLLLLSTVVDFSVGRALSQTNNERRRRHLAALSLVSNLGILGFFKYVGFFSEGFRDLAGLAGVQVSPFVLDIVLPAGISFYTFQTLSYTLDIYRRRLEPTQNFFDFALFVAFFPQLVAGPIERARRLLPQIVARREISLERINAGAWLILWGLYKKVAIADNLAAVVDAVYRPGSNATSGELILATYAFAWQIYCDFSGYTDIARGTARMMGFDLMLNFRVPYAAANPAEFWRRWHISLSEWLRDYLYISLGGNRLGAWFTYRNLFLTMVIGGLWHGAAWPFVLWGAYHGALLMGHRFLRRTADGSEGASDLVSGVRRMLHCFVLFQFVSLGWLIFRAESLAHIGELLGVLTGPFEAGLAGDWIFPFCFILAPLVAMQIAQERTKALDVVLRLPLAARALVYASLATGILLIGEQVGQPFIYFQF